MPADFDDMEMPTPCRCGEWFDLLDGFTSADNTRSICKNCYQQEKIDNT